MSYINNYKLIQYILEGKKPDARVLLEEVDEKSILSSLKKSKDGLPKNIAWTDEPIEERNFAKLPWKVKRNINKTFQLLLTKPSEQIPILSKLKKQYPNIPVLYNYLAIAYNHTKQLEKYQESIYDTVKLFPDYLFGKISLAEYHLNNYNHTEIHNIFNNKFEIYLHYPTSHHIFHISEVRSFYSVIGVFHARSGKIARAIYCYFILHQIDPNHLAAVRLADEIILKEISKIKSNMDK